MELVFEKSYAIIFHPSSFFIFEKGKSDSLYLQIT